MKICHNCGAQMSDDELICHKCHSMYKKSDDSKSGISDTDKLMTFLKKSDVESHKTETSVSVDTNEADVVNQPEPDTEKIMNEAREPEEMKENSESDEKKEFSFAKSVGCADILSKSDEQAANYGVAEMTSKEETIKEVEPEEIKLEKPELETVNDPFAAMKAMSFNSKEEVDSAKNNEQNNAKTDISEEPDKNERPDVTEDFANEEIPPALIESGTDNSAVQPDVFSEFDNTDSTEAAANYYFSSDKPTEKGSPKGDTETFPKHEKKAWKSRPKRKSKPDAQGKSKKAVIVIIAIVIVAIAVTVAVLSSESKLKLSKNHDSSYYDTYFETDNSNETVSESVTEQSEISKYESKVKYLDFLDRQYLQLAEDFGKERHLSDSELQVEYGMFDVDSDNIDEFIVKISDTSEGIEDYCFYTLTLSEKGEKSYDVMKLDNLSSRDSSLFICDNTLKLYSHSFVSTIEKNGNSVSQSNSIYVEDDCDYDELIILNYFDVVIYKNEISADSFVPNISDYTDTIKQYYYERLSDIIGFGYNPAGYETYYYCIKDINSDGIEELIISENPDENIISGLYTYYDGKVENVFRQERQGRYYIISDGFIEYHYKYIDICELNGNKIENIYSSPFVFSYEDDYEEMESEFNKYKTENGFSTEYMEFDFLPYHFSE